MRRVNEKLGYVAAAGLADDAPRPPVTRADPVRFYYFSELWWAFGSTVSFTVTGVYFVRELDLDPLQLVLVGTVMELSVFVFEVPTGVVADTYSRRLSVIIGWLILGVGLVLVGLVEWYPAVLIGYVIWGLGWTFTSGAYTAWITDEIGIDRVGRVLARGQQLAYAGSIVGIFVSIALARSALGSPSRSAVRSSRCWRWSARC